VTNRTRVGVAVTNDDSCHVASLLRASNIAIFVELCDAKAYTLKAYGGAACDCRKQLASQGLNKRAAQNVPWFFDTRHDEPDR
jgi:hypothetical protein